MRRIDAGRLIARGLCIFFAAIGALPLAGGYLAQTEPVRRWAAKETSRVLEELLGVTARYDVQLSLWPLRLSLANVELAASDGGSPAFEAQRISVSPRLFSLLAGRLDIGDVAIDQPRGRLVVRQGKLENVSYHLPEAQAPSGRLQRAPFSSLAITEGHVLVDVDGTVIEAGPMDVDVFAEAGPAFEIALRVGRSRVDRIRPVPDGGPPGVASLDEDILCELDVRLRLDEQGALVRRLSLLGGVDGNPAPNSRPSCAIGNDDTHRLALRLSQVRAVLGGEGSLDLLDGHVMARAPMHLADRFAPGPFRGWAGFVGDVHYEAGSTLPELSGTLRGEGIEMAEYRFSEQFEGEVTVQDGVVRAPRLEAQYGHGRAVVENFSIEPLSEGIPLHVDRVVGRGVIFPDFMELIGVTDDTIVNWHLDKTVVTDFGGTIQPLKLDGGLYAETTDFSVFDRAYHRPDRHEVIGVDAATIRGTFGVRSSSIQFMNTHAHFGHSDIFSSVSVGFDNTLWLDIEERSKIDLSDASPLAGIEMSGVADISANMAGQADVAELSGDLRVDDLVFGGYPIGDILSSRFRFVPLKVDIYDVTARKGRSRFSIPSARLDFGTSASILADASVHSSPFFIGDFLDMWHLDQDPRFSGIAGDGDAEATIHYDLGGPKDDCGAGLLRVAGSLDAKRLDLFDEHYETGQADFDFRWLDPEASHLGMHLDVPSFALHKGTGTLAGSLRMTDGAKLRGHVVATEIPLSDIQALGDAGKLVDARLSGIGELYGTLDEMEAGLVVRLGPARLGRATLPSSEITVALTPSTHPKRAMGQTACGRPIPPPADSSRSTLDRSSGIFRIDGSLFGGQIGFDAVEVTWQDDQRIAGNVTFSDLDLGALAELTPLLALSERRARGRFSGRLAIEELRSRSPGEAAASLAIDQLWVGQGGFRAEIEGNAPIAVRDGELSIPDLTLVGRLPSGHRGVFDVSGRIRKLGRAPELDLELAMRQADLSGFKNLVPRASRLSGLLDAKVRLTGPLTRLEHRGHVTLTDGELSLHGVPLSIRDANLGIRIEPDRLEIVQGEASIGGGTLKLWGGAPLTDLEMGRARLMMMARDVGLPVTRGLDMAVNADLEATYDPSEADEGRTALPRVTGNVRLASFEYTRKVTMTADISTLGKRGRRTQFESYDPDRDAVEFNVTVTADRSLSINNDLMQAKLEIDDPGLVLSGTNQRFGAQGRLVLVKGGHIRLRRNDFEITQGYVRFADMERIAPQVDVTAVTEYRRYSGSHTATAQNMATSGTAAGGRWRITMHAYGDAEKLRVDLTSEPELGEDDIFLLLTLGLTRAELDQAQSGAGQSVALEALGKLTGADQAVTETIPVIDEFGFGSQYSSRTGRTEPTVTIGKRLSQRIRAYVRSGLSESREVRSNIEWQLTPQVSVQGSYDNVNDISSSSLGNLGANVRWRLEFE